MQEDYPADGGVRIRRICDDGQTEAASGREFVCGRCSRQVVICRCCDRGQVYCNADCAGQTRHEKRREAGWRWQRTRRGRGLHAARMAKCRAKRAKRPPGSDVDAVGMAPKDRPAEIVTHHGSPPPKTGDLLAGEATAMPRDDASPANLPGQAMPHCHWCGRFCPPPLRQGFLRRCDRKRGRVGAVRGECKPP
jgi:hypothetical protein